MKDALPDKLFAKVTCKENPIEGLLLQAALSMEFKDSYKVIFGPTNNIGIAEVSKQIINEEIIKEDSSSAQNHNELKMAIEGYEFYKDFIDFPANYKKNLEESIKTLECLGNKILELESWAIPKTVEVIARPKWRASWLK
jgi:hypothetical protein